MPVVSLAHHLDVVTMRRRVRYDDQDQPRAGSATIASRPLSTLDELARRWSAPTPAAPGSSCSTPVTSTTPTLYRAWVPEQIRREFHGASIRRKDLALYTSLLTGDAVPGSGRQLRAWENEALDQMASHLVGPGFEVLDERPAVEEVPNDWGDPLLGGLRVRSPHRLRNDRFLDRPRLTGSILDGRVTSERSAG